jgi:16S rRNA (uracil1498-N3)-methyltransferase
LRRFLVPRIFPDQDQLTITGSEALHMVRVLRMKAGDRILLMDGEGKRCEAVIRTVGPKEVVVDLEKAMDSPPSSPVKIILCQSLLKAQAMDDLVKKTSELGVAVILPFYSSRTVVKLDPERFERKRGHWERITQSAAKQSDRNMLAHIETLCGFSEICGRFADEAALKVIFWERAGTRDLKEVLRQPSRSRTVIGVVGPEGGFDTHEVALAAESGFWPVSLGRRILRADTAAITFVSIIQYEWGDLAFREMSSLGMTRLPKRE